MIYEVTHTIGTATSIERLEISLEEFLAITQHTKAESVLDSSIRNCIVRHIMEETRPGGILNVHQETNK